METGETVPERRTKSWRREHEEACTRRLNCHASGQRGSSGSSGSDGDSSARPLRSEAQEYFKINQKSLNSSNKSDVPCSDIYFKEDKLWKPFRSKMKNAENVQNDFADSGVFDINVDITYDSKKPDKTVDMISSSNEHLSPIDNKNTYVQRGNVSSTGFTSVSQRGATESNPSEKSNENLDFTKDETCGGFKTSEKKKCCEETVDDRHGSNIHVTSDDNANSLIRVKDLKISLKDSHRSCQQHIHDSDKESVMPLYGKQEENLISRAAVNAPTVAAGCMPSLGVILENTDEGSVQNSENIVSASETGESVGDCFKTSKQISSNKNIRSTEILMKKQLSEGHGGDRECVLGLKEICDNACRETQIISLETYLSTESAGVNLFNDSVGFTIGLDGKVQVVMPRSRINVEEKLQGHNSNPDYQEKLHLVSQVVETEQRIAVKDVLRNVNANIAAQRPDDRYFTKLDSSLKKNTAFVRKLKTFTGSQLENLLKEFLSLNLTKYVSEVAAALVEAKLKMVDVWPAVQLCNVFHGTYSDFSVHLLDNWHKVLTIKKDEKIANAAKLRVDIRFYAELINVGIFTHKEGLPLMGNVLTMLTHSDKDDHLNINIILSFCRHCGDEYAGLVPRKVRELCVKYGISLPRYKLLPKEKQRNVKALLKDYFNSMCKHLLREHLELQSFVRQNRKILQTKGELSSERKERLEILQASFDRVANGAQQFAEALDEDLPSLPEDESLKHETLIMNGSSESEEGTLTASLWEDEETRRFYECLPDMKEFMPSLQVRVPDPEPQISEESLDAEFEGELSGETGHEDEVPLVELDESEDTEHIGNPSNKILLDAFLTALPNCINREMIDSAAVDFVMTLNTKHNRRKLVKTLFNVPRIRLDLLPFYARLVATLHPVMPDVAADLSQMLKQDFKYHVRKKDQMNIESKIKIVRFIGELVKFRMYSKIEGLYCVKVLVQDFTHHHIEMCCNLLESCGRFFFRHPDCHQRMKVYLDQMMRKKAVMALDSRYVTMIENAYYYVNPPESAQSVTKERPVEHQFIRKILYQMLMKSNTDKVLRLMRKLDWSNIETHAYAVKCLTYAFKVKYFNIRCLASLLAGLATHQETVGAQVVDGVMEDIRLGMEVNLPKYNQRRVAMIKYLGELYNYRMVESSNIFQVLYSMIIFGVSWDHEHPSPLDPSDNLFRIRLVCVLLETCGQYFISGMSKKKLDVFLVYFQHYFWFKSSDPVWTQETPFPVGINYMFKDTITNLRPSIHLFTSYSEAAEAIIKLRMEESSTYVPQAEVPAPEAQGNIEEVVDPDHTAEDTSGFNKIGVAEDINEDFEDKEDKEFVDNEKEEEEEDDDDDDFTEPLSGEVDDGEIDWAGNCDASHMSEGDSQSQELPLPADTDLITQGPKLLECPEDEDFLTAFDRMVSDNIQDRMRETVKPQQVDISVPLHIKGSAKKTYDQLQEEESTKSSVNFILMLRKGHKQQYKSLEVPVNSEMALNLKNREEAERAEKERVKRLTLDINERLEEEDYQEMLAQAQRPVVMNLNRERRHKYQHPKGAPDADLIFGPKKVR